MKELKEKLKWMKRKYPRHEHFSLGKKITGTKTGTIFYGDL